MATYSFGASCTQSIGMSHVSSFVGELLGQSANTVRQRLRENLYDAADKRGRKRRDLKVEMCFAPLLGWIVKLWRQEDNLLMLALDASSLGSRFTVLSVSVLVQQTAIPVAWVIVREGEKGKWQPYWKQLLKHLAGVTGDLTVVVAADRGLYAKWLYEDIQALGWHPLLRLRAQGTCTVLDSGQELSLAELAQRVQGGYWHGRVRCFLGDASLEGTLLALGDPQQKEAWLLLTDCAPETVSPSWYGLRMWIEEGFKACKTGALHWERTRMTDPRRAARLWLVLALTLLFTLSTTPAPTKPSPTPPRLSCVKQGILRVLAWAIRQTSLPPFALYASSPPPSPVLEFCAALNTYP
ncbi:MAG: transposase [Caldilineaceae bacterium]